MRIGNTDLLDIFENEELFSGLVEIRESICTQLEVITDCIRAISELMAVREYLAEQGLSRKQITGFAEYLKNNNTPLKEGYITEAVGDYIKTLPDGVQIEWIEYNNAQPKTKAEKKKESAYVK